MECHNNTYISSVFKQYTLKMIITYKSKAVIVSYTTYVYPFLWFYAPTTPEDHQINSKYSDLVLVIF